MARSDACAGIAERVPTIPQCYLRLAPHTRCDTASYRGMFVASLLTLVFYVAGFPLLCSWALWHGPQRTWLATSLRFLLQSVRLTWWRALWAGPVRFGKNLLFAAIVGASDFNQTSFPFVAFCAILGLLFMQARLRARPPRPSYGCVRLRF
jgi:hypothetical protein